MLPLQKPDRWSEFLVDQSHIRGRMVKQESLDFLFDDSLLVFGETLGMVSEHFEHTAVCNRVFAAFDNHSVQLGAKRFQPCDPTLNLYQLSLRDPVDLGTRMVGGVG